MITMTRLVAMTMIIGMIGGGERGEVCMIIDGALWALRSVLIRSL